MKKITALAMLMLIASTPFWAQGLLLSLNHDDAGLGLAATYLATEDYIMVGENGTTSDGYPSGVADLDCFSERFFYTRHPNKLVTLDAVTGEILHNVTVDNPLDADVPFTNIAYDWTDDKLYGIAHWYSNGTNVQLVASTQLRAMWRWSPTAPITARRTGAATATSTPSATGTS